MQARLFPVTLLLIFSCGTLSLMAQRVASIDGSIDIQGSRTKVTGTLTDATMIMAITKTNVGTRKGQTITIERETDAASPNLYQALNSKEVLPKVIFKVYKPGDPTKYKLITIENAIITKINKGTKQPNTGKTNANTHEKEEIGFTFEKIDIQYSGGSTSTSDDWDANNQ
jgi:type VI secretion system Hcp family effector